jgi:hypothetical protein
MIKRSQYRICFKYAVVYARIFLMAQRINLDLTRRVTADRRAITAVALYHELRFTRFSSVHGSYWSIF